MIKIICCSKCNTMPESNWETDPEGFGKFRIFCKTCSAICGSFTCNDDCAHCVFAEVVDKFYFNIMV